MANLLFLMRYPLAGGDNLTVKFNGQMAAARALGHRASFIGWDGAGMCLCEGEKRVPLVRCPLSRMPGYSKTALYVDLIRALERALMLERFDAVYMRYMRLFGNAPRAMTKAKASGAKLIVEHPTYPFEHGRTTSLLREPVLRYCDSVFKRIEPMIDLYALIGDPCDGMLNGVPAMNIVNGVDVDSLPAHQPRVDARDVGMLALASMSRWQGYDRLIEALARYEGGERVTVHMVGGEGDGSLAEWRALAARLGVGENIIFHGELHGAALDEVVAACDIGVGGLGLHRRGQMCSMTLKLREYMARGLPFVYAVDDPSISREPRFCLRLPNDDSAIDLASLVAFALRARADAGAGEAMRAYARERMSWQGILEDVLERVGIACPER